MTPISITFSRPQVRGLRSRRYLAAVCVTALLALPGFTSTAFGQTSAPLDTSALPRPAAIKQLVALPQTTIILSSASVPEASSAALALLEASGWQRYVAPNTQGSPQSTSVIHMLKKGSQGLMLFVDKAPAHGNASAINYTALPLTRDLPFPRNGSDIKFSTDPLHLDAKAPSAVEALMTFYRAELTVSGWKLHSASDGSATMQIPTGDGMHHAFFTHTTLGALHVTVKNGNEGQSVIAIRSVPAGVLPGAQIARAPEPVAPQQPNPQPNPQAQLHAGISQQMDSMVQDVMKQAMQPPPRNPAFEAAAAAALSAARARSEPQARVPTPVGAAPAMPSEPVTVLESDASGELLVPKPHGNKSQTRTKWRTEATATVKANQASVLAFYRKELSARGWREAGQPAIKGERTVLEFASPEGPAVLTLDRMGQNTEVSLLLRKEKDARASGKMPKSGHSTIIIANTLDTDSSVSLGGSSIKVAAGVGAKAPNGPSFEVRPGTYKLTVRNPGKPDYSESLTVGANDIWGIILIGPGEALPLQMY